MRTEAMRKWLVSRSSLRSSSMNMAALPATSTKRSAQASMSWMPRTHAGLQLSGSRSSSSRLQEARCSRVSSSTSATEAARDSSAYLHSMGAHPLGDSFSLVGVQRPRYRRTAFRFVGIRLLFRSLRHPPADLANAVMGHHEGTRHVLHDRGHGAGSRRDPLALDNRHGELDDMI